MKLSTRYGAVGLAALALLTATHWLRDTAAISVDAIVYLLGVLPNVAAAVAIPFVITAIRVDHLHRPSTGAARTWFRLAAWASCAGLVAWEFVQQGSRRLRFDPDDIGATLLGTLLAFAVFWLVTPRAEPGQEMR